MLGVVAARLVGVLPTVRTQSITVLTVIRRGGEHSGRLLTRLKKAASGIRLFAMSRALLRRGWRAHLQIASSALVIAT